MLKALFQDKPMTANYTSGWFDFNIKNARNFKSFEASSLQVVWTNVIGMPINGTLQIQITSDIGSVVVFSTINITTASNVSNASLTLLTSYSDKIRVVFTKNNITSGKLSCFINYRSVQ